MGDVMLDPEFILDFGILCGLLDIELMPDQSGWPLSDTTADEEC